ncbi:MAG: cation:proton antiporter [Pseudomonadota bacterium]
MSFLPTLPLHLTPLIIFGLLLLFGAIGGYLAHRLTWLPSITGFMIIGYFIGPNGLSLLSEAAMASSKIIISIALALILYRLGLSLDLRELRRKPSLLLTALVESSMTFAAVLSILIFFDVPVSIAAIIAAILISSSPAVLLHVAHEVGAEGPTTDATKTLVALNNCISFIAFSALLPMLHYSVGNGWVEIVLQPVYRLFGSLLLGVALGVGLYQLALRMKDAAQYKLAIVIGGVMFAVGMSELLNLSVFVVPLVMGVTIATIEREYSVSHIEFGSAFELFFIVLFVYAGANLHVHELIASGALVLAVVGVRTLAKVLSVTMMSPVQNVSIRSGFSTGLLLIPMAGMAIGLTQTASNLFAAHASMISVIVLGAVALFETMGPPIAKMAFRLCGEATDMTSAKTIAAEESARH